MDFKAAIEILGQFEFDFNGNVSRYPDKAQYNQAMKVLQEISKIVTYDSDSWDDE